MALAAIDKSDNAPFRWLRLLVAIIVVTPASLGVHELMLEGFHVPFPQPAGLPIWAPYLTLLLSALALLTAVRLSAPRLDRLPVAGRCALVTLICLMLHESFRVLIIDSTLTDAWLFQAIKAAPRLLTSLAFCSAAVLAAPALRSIGSNLVAGAGLSAVALFALQPGFDRLFMPALKALAGFDYPQIYNEPFTGHVLPMIYVEAVIATFALAALV